MGDIIKRVYCKISKEDKIAFFSSFICGFFMHLYKITNYLPNHDSVYSYYTDGNMLEYGRWFLTIICRISSNFDLPWVCGLLTILYVSITAVFIVRLFNITNKVVIALCGAILVSYPAITDILFYEYIADGFTFAMLLSALAVYLIRLEKATVWRLICSILLICLACATYQSYLSFALVLMICYYIWILLTTKEETKVYAKWVIYQFICIILGVLLYYLGWKLCLILEKSEPTSLYGIDTLGISASTILGAFRKSIATLYYYFFEQNVFTKGFTTFGLFNLLFFLCFSMIIIVSIIKSKIWKNKSRILLTILCLLVTPFAITIWLFASPELEYGVRMLQSVSLLFVFSIILCNQYVKCKLSDLYALFICVTVFYYGLSANVANYFLTMEYETVYSEAVELKSDIESLKKASGENTAVAIIGTRGEGPKGYNYLLSEEDHIDEIHVFAHTLEKSFLFDRKHISGFLSKVLYYDGRFIEDVEIENRLASTDEFKQMSCWPDEGSVQLIDDIIVIKLSDPQ